MLCCLLAIVIFLEVCSMLQQSRYEQRLIRLHNGLHRPDHLPEHKRAKCVSVILCTHTAGGMFVPNSPTCWLAQLLERQERGFGRNAPATCCAASCWAVIGALDGSLCCTRWPSGRTSKSSLSILTRPAPGCTGAQHECAHRRGWDTVGTRASCKHTHIDAIHNH